jgi:hypothetical protein
MRPFFDVVTDELHARLSEWAHHDAKAQSRVVVRRLLPGSNTITIDIAKPRPSNADRFVVAYRTDQLPATIVATVGTLTTTEREATFDTLEALQKWMLEIAQVCNL